MDEQMTNGDITLFSSWLAITCLLRADSEPWESSDVSLVSAPAGLSSALHDYSHPVSQCQDDKRRIINGDSVWATKSGKESRSSALLLQ